MNTLKYYERQDLLIGTFITQRIYGENAENAAIKALKELEYIEEKMSFFRKDSDVSKINSNSGENSVRVNKDTIHVILQAKKYGNISQGAFDITVAPIVKSWGIFTQSQKVPSDSEIKSNLKLVDYNYIEIDEKQYCVKLRKKGQMIDLGGIAKGYAGDKAVQIYKENGIKSAFINLGGDILALGEKPNGLAWKVGIQNPNMDIDSYIGIASVKDKAVVTSGAYQRYFVQDNQKYHHIIDPRTGYPSQSDLISATIIADISIIGEALSTPAFVMGLEESIKMIKKLDGVEAIFMTKDENIHATSRLLKSFTLSDKSKKINWI